MDELDLGQECSRTHHPEETSVKMGMFRNVLFTMVTTGHAEVTTTLLPLAQGA